jgi:Ras-related protein Rab-7A
MSTSTSIAPTITPERYADDLHRLAQAKAARPARGPKLFFTSAKTGAGVSEVFAYVARRVVMRWEWEEEAVYVDVPDFDGDNSTVHLKDGMTKSFRPACCSS